MTVTLAAIVRDLCERQGLPFDEAELAKLGVNQCCWRLAVLLTTAEADEYHRQYLRSIGTSID